MKAPSRVPIQSMMKLAVASGDRFSHQQLKNAIKRVERGLFRYLELKMLFASGVDVRDRSFQKLFNGFYRVSRRTPDWYVSFYDVFYEALVNNFSFDQILEAIFRATGRVEASFASKIRASIDESSVVIDSVVLSNVGLKLSRSGDPEQRMRAALQTYKELEKSINAIRASDFGIFIIDEFRRSYPHATVTDVKAIDLTLWQLR